MALIIMIHLAIDDSQPDLKQKERLKCSDDGPIPRRDSDSTWCYEGRSTMEICYRDNRNV